ncbi:hypothetical protein B0H21DRAFT_743581 [Amylocystis lapponica]|nr:hypothetical protein B0H21DRAFT_743581 [Amylocystis lapponica]
MGFWDLLLVPLALLKTLVEFFAPACRLINRSDHFAPHPTAGFEGYYSRTRLEDGGCLVIIFCWVKTGKRRANLVFRLYSQSLLSFVVHAPGLGTFDVSPEKIEYTISVPDVQLSLNLCLTNRTAWRNSEALSGPMGPLLHLSHLVPLNWHVHAPTSDAVLTLTHAEHGMQGHGITHVEKNWGTSFPRGWLWGQAFGAEGTTLAFAGGAAFPGVHLYLLGYRSRAYAWDFRPPFAAAIGPFSPFLRVAHDSREGKAHLEVRTFTRKLVVKIEAPPESFTPFPAPLEDGHRPGFAYESFKGRTWVELWSRRWPWQEWACVEQGFCRMSADEEPCSALEFGGFFCHRVEEEKKKA